MGDARLKILEEAYQVLESQGESPIPREYLLKLLDILAISLEKYAQESGEQAEDLAKHLIDHRGLLLMLKQQTDELDALKRLGLNLTSSLDLQTVLDAVVTEAMHLVKHARAAHIYLYHNEVLEFGASLNADGIRNKPLSNPRHRRGAAFHPRLRGGRTRRLGSPGLVERQGRGSPRRGICRPSGTPDHGRSQTADRRRRPPRGLPNHRRQRGDVPRHRRGAMLARVLRGDTRSVLTVSAPTSFDDLGPVSLSLPRVVGSDGIVATLEPVLNADEEAAIRRSVQILQEAAATIRL